MYTDVLHLLADFDTKTSRKNGSRFINTLPQVLIPSPPSPFSSLS